MDEQQRLTTVDAQQLALLKQNQSDQHDTLVQTTRATTQLKAPLVQQQTGAVGQAQAGAAIEPALQPSIRLPKFEFTKFASDISDWKPFWKSFTQAVGPRVNLSDIKILNYVGGYLVGDVALTIRGLATTDANYKIATDLLEEVYRNDEAINYPNRYELDNLPAVKNFNDLPGLK